jgi:hypothetical protein
MAPAAPPAPPAKGSPPGLKDRPTPLHAILTRTHASPLRKAAVNCPSPAPCPGSPHFATGESVADLPSIISEDRCRPVSYPERLSSPGPFPRSPFRLVELVIESWTLFGPALSGLFSGAPAWAILPFPAAWKCRTVVRTRPRLPPLCTRLQLQLMPARMPPLLLVAVASPSESGGLRAAHPAGRRVQWRPAPRRSGEGAGRGRARALLRAGAESRGGGGSAELCLQPLLVYNR